MDTHENGGGIQFFGMTLYEDPEILYLLEAPIFRRRRKTGHFRSFMIISFLPTPTVPAHSP